MRRAFPAATALKPVTREAFMFTKRVRRFLSVAAMAPLFLTACDSNPFDPDDETGTYQLTFYDGASVPVTFNCQPGDCGLPNGGTLRVNSGTLRLRSDGTFTETNSFTERETGSSSSDNYTLTWNGTYDYDGFNLTLFAPAQNNQAARFVDATLEFDTIAYTENGEFYQYER